ncbi:cysteine desulfurase [Seminavis robusta]|uniref:Cysteine desulfurase n=1 Tax=Seminavis robusta TaxID=568900 RepID=A0A9N8HT74_9STRA|nr:cysteine desulfurase [Seminavis robusta]|eukprot:Sro1542_g281030.1 cysteine desulfurase (177) ;mRNA; f:5365-5895
MPHHVDHYGVPIVRVPPAVTGRALEDILELAPKEGAARFEFYESNIANKLGLGKAIRYALDVGMDSIETTVVALAQDLYQRLLRHNPKIRVHHPPASGIVTFYIPGMPSRELKAKLDSANFETSLVPATSTPLDSSQTQVPDMVRVSLSYTNTKQDSDDLCHALVETIVSATAQES